MDFSMPIPSRVAAFSSTVGLAPARAVQAAAHAQAETVHGIGYRFTQ
jgi:hypothetical protein